MKKVHEDFLEREFMITPCMVADKWLCSQLEWRLQLSLLEW